MNKNPSGRFNYMSVLSLCHTHFVFRIIQICLALHNGLLAANIRKDFDNSKKVFQKFSRLEKRPYLCSMSRSREEAVAAGIQVNDIQHNMKRRTKQIEDALTHPLLLSTECMGII